MFSIREADHNDNNDLIKLTRHCPMNGKISLLIDRYPDFFELPAERGNSITLVATSQSNNQVIGSFTVVFFPGFVNGKEERILYMADLKVHPEFRKQKMALELLKSMERHVQKFEPGIVICLLAGGNKEVFRFLKTESAFPDFFPFGKFHVLEIFPTSKKSKRANNEIQKVEEEFMFNELINFYNEIHKAYELAPVVEIKALQNCHSYVIMQDLKIVAAISLIDPISYKQNIVLNMPLYLKFVTAALRIVKPLFRLASIPKVSQPIRTLFFRAYGYVKNEEKNFESLISFARRFAYEKGYHFLSVGLYEKDPRMKLFDRIPKIRFLSHLLIADFKNSDNRVKKMIEHGIPYMDFSLV